MKKILLSFLILGIISISSQGFSALYDFDADFTTSSGMSDWSPLSGSSWLPVPSSSVYMAIPGSGGVAAFDVAVLPDLFSTGMVMEAIFRPVNGDKTGIFFGGYGTFNIGLYKGAGDSIYLELDGQVPINLNTLYPADYLKLNVVVDFDNTLYWWVYQANSNSSGYADVDFGILAGVNVLPGSVGVFSEGAGAAFAAFAVEGHDTNPVPVPAAIWLFGSGILGLVGLKRRQR